MTNLKSHYQEPASVLSNRRGELEGQRAELLKQKEALFGSKEPDPFVSLRLDLGATSLSPLQTLQRKLRYQESREPALPCLSTAHERGVCKLNTSITERVKELDEISKQRRTLRADLQTLNYSENKTNEIVKLHPQCAMVDLAGFLKASLFSFLVPLRVPSAEGSAKLPSVTILSPQARETKIGRTSEPGERCVEFVACPTPDSESLILRMEDIFDHRDPTIGENVAVREPRATPAFYDLTDEQIRKALNPRALGFDQILLLVNVEKWDWKFDYNSHFGRRTGHETTPVPEDRPVDLRQPLLLGVDHRIYESTGHVFVLPEE